jgi:choice-of-anchor A domain-containing protein
MGGWITTASAAAANCASLGEAAAFDVFSQGVYEANGTTLPGRAAAAGNIAVSSISIGASASGQAYDLISGADITGTNGTVDGGVRYAGDLHTDPSFNITGQRSHGNPPFSFDEEFTRLAQLNSELGAQPDTAGNTVALNQYSRALEIGTTDPSLPLYVFTISGALLAQAAGFQITLPAAATAVINVTGPSVSVTGAQYMNLNGIPASHVVWNFVRVSDFTLGGSVEWRGTLLAPNTDFTDTGSQNLDGQVIAKSARTNRLTIIQAPFSGCLPVPPHDTPQLDALCVDAAGRLSFRLRNVGTADIPNVVWKDLDSAQGGSFTLFAGQDRYFSLDAGDGLAHTVRVKAGPDVLEATGQPRPCRATITVTQRVVGPAPAGTWTVVLSGSAGVVRSEELGPDESFTEEVQGGYVDGSVPIGAIPGGAVYEVTQPDPRGGVTTISQQPITVTDGETAEVGVVTIFSATPEPTPTPTPEPTPTPTPTPEPPPIVEPGQPTLPPGAPDPPPGPDLVRSAPGDPAADLEVTHTIAPRRFDIGEELSITVHVRNRGKLAATGTVLRELPQYPRLRAGQVARITTLTTSAGSCRRARPARCTLGTVRPGQRIVLHARARVLVAGELHSVLFISSDTPESNLTNNESIADLTSLRAPTGLRVRVSAPPTGRVGSRYAYRVTISAQAPKGARLCTRIPSGFTDHGATGTFLWHRMRCRDYSSLRGSRSFTVSGVPTTGGTVTLPARGAAVGSARIARDAAPARIGVSACLARVRC